jgi:ribosome modulation factor
MGRKPRQADGEAPRGRGRPAKEKPDGSNVTPALIAEATAQYVEDRAMIARATARCGANLKRFEAQGIDSEWIKENAKELKYTQDEAAQRAATRLRYKIAVGIIKIADAQWASNITQAGFEFTAAAGEADEKMRAARASTEGYRAGKNGHSLDSSPYNGSPGSVEFVSWRDGHGKGMADRALMKPGSEKVVSVSTGHGRRKAATPAESGDGSEAIH